MNFRTQVELSIFLHHVRLPVAEPCPYRTVYLPVLHGCFPLRCLSVLFVFNFAAKGAGRRHRAGDVYKRQVLLRPNWNRNAPDYMRAHL